MAKKKPNREISIPHIKQIVPVLLILLVTFLAYHKTLFFYFWHDDFSILYNATNKICPFNWPFNSYCPVFEWLYRMFDFNPKPYFFLGFILRFILGSLFFLLCKKLFKTSILSLLLACLVVSVGGEDSILTFYSISENIGISLLLLILLLLNYFKEKKSLIYLTLSCLLFFISLYIFPIYSAGHILILLPFTLYLLKNLKGLTLILLAFFISTVLITYIWVPYNQSGEAFQFWSRAGGHKITKDYVLGKFTNFIQTSGSFVLTDYIEGRLRVDLKIKNTEQIRLIAGFIINMFFLFFIWVNRKDKKIFSLGIFAFIWIITQYIPKGLVTTTGLGSTDRHIFYPYIGFVLALGAVAFKNLKVWKYVLLGVLILNLLQTNHYFGDFENINQSRTFFYQQLSNFFKVKPDQAIIYVDSPRGEIQLQLGDFMRVGMHPSESSVATKLGMKMENLTLITSSSDLVKYLNNQKFRKDTYYSFYWDGNNLIDTTDESRSLLFYSPVIIKEINSISKMQFYQNEQKKWTGKNDGIDFIFNDFKPLLPTNLILTMKASVPEFPTPFTLNCFKCLNDPELLRQVLDSIVISRTIKQSAQVTASNVDNNTVSENLINFNLNDFWMANRNEWFQGIKPVISLRLKEKTDIDGVVIYASSKFRIPKSFEISINGKKIDYNLEYSNGKTKLIFKDTQLNSLDIKILSTEGDTPIIEEISFIPQGYADVNLDILDQVRQFPAGSIDTLDSREHLKEYLFFGVDSCIKWQSKNYGEGKLDFLLKVDGLIHTYFVTLPTIGLTPPILSIDCLNYPIDLELISGSFNFLGNHE